MAHLTLALIGATGCIGKEILDLLEEDDRVGAVVPIASKGSKESQVVFRGKSISLRYLELSAFDGVGLAIAACPVSVGKAGLEFLVEEGIPLIDLSGSWGTTAPLLAAGFDLGHAERWRETGVVTAARPEAIVVSRVLRAINDVAPVLKVGGTLLMPSSVAGRDGVEELSRQVVAMFNSQEAPRKRFLKGLAFDVLPSWGGVGDRGWAGYELLAALQIGLLARINPQAVGLDVLVVPLFGGMMATIRVDLQSGWQIEAVREALDNVPELELVDETQLMPRGFIGSTDIAVGRLRADLSGHALHLTICCDPPRIAAENAISLMENLLWSEA
jgi:aspartate-semialdehyde dehydrogenase